MVRLNWTSENSEKFNLDPDFKNLEKLDPDSENLENFDIQPDLNLEKFDLDLNSEKLDLDLNSKKNWSRQI